LREIGMGDLPVIVWAAIVGPAGIPKDIVERLNKGFVAAASKPDVKAQIEQVGAYRKLVQTIGMPVE
jgi:tripartite-type tricarboxylate transporter receptor subunit TctC